MITSLPNMQKSSSSCQLQGYRHQISSAHHSSSPTTKQKSASTSTLHGQRRNSYGGGSKVNTHEPSSPVPRHGRSHLLASTYHPKHSLLTRSGGSGGGGGLTRVSAGTSPASKQGVDYRGGGGGGGVSRSHRQPSKNNASDLIVTSARIVSSL